uniref:Exonuclease family protein n=1 Tax=Trepomonas sp. PC1 TaxID=1076344 RepID=A0A146K520_9EUKA|eukprot:JAP92010.1 Hypothetical protein TPC1_16179 [Trepomonas sp. PC1]
MKQNFLTRADQVTQSTTLIFLDFEASYCDQTENWDIIPETLLISEIGAVKMQNFQIVGQFHSLIDQNQKVLQQVQRQADCRQRFNETKNLTGIPAITDIEYKNLSVRPALEVLNDFKTFCGSGDIAVIAKGISMEQTVMNIFNMGITVLELMDMKRPLGFSFINAKAEFIHGARKQHFCYCDFHKQFPKQLKLMYNGNQQYLHCALDDSFVMAKQVIHARQQKQRVE